MKKNIKAIKALVLEVNASIEIALLSMTKRVMKAKHDDRIVEVVGLGIKGNYFYMKGLINTKFPVSRGVYRARDIAKENFSTSFGPMPSFPPHRIVLVPFPSLLFAGPKILHEVYKEWQGFTYSYELPYVEYKIMN